MADPIFSLLPNPHWVVIDNFSKLPNGAVIYTYSSLDPSVWKPAYQDAAGTTPYSQPIIGLGNGTFLPIFWKFDPDMPADNYYIRVYDRLNNPGSGAVFLWDFNGLSGSTGGGGGGGTTTSVSDVENLVVNNVFFRNIGDTNGTPSLPLSLTIAPSTHQGFVNDPANVNVANNGPVGPDIIFAKSNTSASDNIKFVPFTPLGTRELSTTDITPQIYLQYNCTGIGTSETYKYFQFPISQGVQNLGEQAFSLRFYGKCESGSNQVSLSWRQFFGSGGGSADAITSFIGSPFTLTNSFSDPPIRVQGNIPSVTGKILGTCGNDGLFLLVGMPLNATTTIDFVKTELYLGDQVPTVEYDTHDQIDSLTNTPRTGDIRISMNSFQPYGWVAMNDGTIANGNPGIVAPAGGFARNNVDTFPLFSLLWNLPIAVVPEYDAAGIATTRGASAADDFTANRQLALTKAAGRVFAGVSGLHTIGTFDGVDSHALTLGEIPNHTHAAATGQFIYTGPAGGIVLGGPVGAQSPATGTISSYPGQSALSLLQPTVFCNVYIKL